MKKNQEPPPPYGGSETFAWLHWETYRNLPKKSDYASIMVKMCSNEPQTNPYDVKN